MKKCLLFLLVITGATAFAQTKHVVTVTNGSFTPSTLTITAGDTIEWNNTQGFHYVDGSQAVFATNPESFGNPDDGGAPWTWSHVFNVAGNYAYRCGIHTTTMFGGFTVNAATGVDEVTTRDGLFAYPNPATDKLFVSKQNVDKVEIYDELGKVVLLKENVSGAISLEGIEKGNYIVKIYNDSDVKSEKILIQ